MYRYGVRMYEVGRGLPRQAGVVAGRVDQGERFQHGGQPPLSSFKPPFRQTSYCCSNLPVSTLTPCPPLPTPQVKQLSSEDVEHKELFRRNVSATHLLQIEADGADSPPPSPKRSVSSDDYIRFNR